ncbi:MAG: site-specific integrase [Desulfobulbaceae bacterium]|nr:site-specific integrase [Desulfobulbaceae bacterium]
MRGCRPLTRDEVAAAVEAIRGPAASRTKALLLVGINTGFRISELLALTVGDVVTSAGEITRRVTVARRCMKGRHSSRTVLINSAARAALLQWLSVLAVRGYIHATDTLWPSFRTGRVIGRVQAWRLLVRAFVAAGLDGQLGTHCLRKTFAANVYDELLERVAMGEPVDAFRAVSKLLGHAEITSTDKYLSFRLAEHDGVVERAGVAI